MLDGVQRLELEEVVGWFSAIERSLSLGVYFWGSFTVGGSREGEESCLAGLLSRLCMYGAHIYAHGYGEVTHLHR